MYTLNENLQYISVFLFILFAVFLLSRKENQTSSRLLAGFMLAKMICICDLLLWFHFNYFYYHLPHLFYVGWPFYFLYFPLLYLYTRSVAEPWKKIKASDVKFIAIFIIAVIIQSINFYFLPGAEKQILIADPAFGRLTITYFLLFYYPQAFGFIFYSLKMLFQYRKRVQNYYSATDKINLSWLDLILKLFLVILIISFMDDIFRLANTPYQVYIALLQSVSFLVFASALIFKGLAQKHSVPVVIAEVKDKSPNIDEQLLNKYMVKLDIYMRDEKPYLLPAITLGELADKVSIPERSLSYIINNYKKKNFFDFINSYRIEDAKTILQKQNRPKTVLEVLYSVGFNSKSVFNTAFKKYTGMTPTEFTKLS